MSQVALQLTEENKAEIGSPSEPSLESETQLRQTGEAHGHLQSIAYLNAKDKATQNFKENQRKKAKCLLQTGGNAGTLGGALDIKLKQRSKLLAPNCKSFELEIYVPI